MTNPTQEIRKIISKRNQFVQTPRYDRTFALFERQSEF